jgi:proteic killer suppression protein
LIIDQPDTLSFKKYNGLNYEKLKGDKAGLSSVRINDQYRIEFEEKTTGEQAVVTICNIVELSNHYK